MTDTTPNPPQTADHRKEGLAIASLILGILSIPWLLGLLAAIPALIAGCIAARRAKAKPDHYGGRAFAIAGVILGCLGLLSTVSLSVWSTRDARRQVCRIQLQRLGGAFERWSANHSHLLPFEVASMDGGTKEQAQPNAEGWDQNASIHIRVLANDDRFRSEELVCPSDSSRVKASSFDGLRTANVSYEIQTGIRSNTNSPRRGLVARCPIHGILLHRDVSVTKEQRE